VPRSIHEREEALRRQWERLNQAQAKREATEAEALYAAMKRDLPERFGDSGSRSERLSNLEGAFRRAYAIPDPQQPDPARLVADADAALDVAHRAALGRDPCEADAALRDELRRVADRARRAADELDSSTNSESE
jgi:hypothetical protein